MLNELIEGFDKMLPDPTHDLIVWIGIMCVVFLVLILIVAIGALRK